MKKIKHLHFYEEIYGANFVFIFNVSKDKDVVKVLTENYPGALELYNEQLAKLGQKEVSIEDCSGLTIDNEEGGRIIIAMQPIKDTADFYAVLAHECLHAVFNIFNSRQVEYIDKPTAHNESFTYYLSHLMRKALQS